MTTQVSKQSMSSTLAYAAVAMAVVIGYLVALKDTNLRTQMSDNYVEIALSFVIIFLGAVASWMKARPGAVLTTAVLAAFVILTVGQAFLFKYLLLAAAIFSIGVYGMLTSRNAVRVLMSIELMLNAVNINLVAFSRYIDAANVRGQVFAIFILTVAAAEAAVGLAIVLSLYRSMSTVDMDRFNIMKW